MLSGFEHRPAAQAANMIAGFDHSRERANFKQFSSIVDRNAGASGYPVNTKEPQFFSENVASLSDMFANVSNEKMTERQDGNRILQTVTYDWKE